MVGGGGGGAGAGGGGGRVGGGGGEAVITGHLLLRCFNVGWPIDTEETHMRSLQAAGGPMAAGLGKLRFLQREDRNKENGRCQRDSRNSRLVALPGIDDDSVSLNMAPGNNNREISLLPSLLEKYRFERSSEKENENDYEEQNGGSANRKLERLKKVCQRRCVAYTCCCCCCCCRSCFLSIILQGWVSSVVCRLQL